MQRTLPHGDSTHIQPPSAMPGRLRRARIDEQVVVRVDLAQPRVLRVPRVVHRHRPLRDRSERIAREIGRLRLQRRVVERQRIEVALDALAQVLRRLPARPLALRGEPELLQHLGIELDQDRIVEAAHAHALRPFHVALVPVAHVLVRRRQLVVEHAVVVRVHLPLLRVRLALQELVAVLAAPAGEEADARARLGLVVDDEVGVVAELARAVGVDEGRELEPATRARSAPPGTACTARSAAPPERAPSRSARRTPRSAGRASTSRRGARGTSCRAARGRRTRSSPTGTRRRRRGTGSCTRRPSSRSFSIRRTSAVFMVEFHAMLAMKISSVSIAVRVAAPRVGDHVVHQPVHRQRVLPREGLVDAHRRCRRRRRRDRRATPASPSASPPSGVFGLHGRGRVRRLGGRRDRARERRLVAEAAGPVDRAEQRHQDRERADRLEAVRMRGEPAHRVERDRIAGHGRRARTPHESVHGIGSSIFWSRAVTPISCARRRIVAAGMPVISRRPLGRVVAHALVEQLKRGLHRRAVGQRVIRRTGRIGAGRVRSGPAGSVARSHHSLFCGYIGLTSGLAASRTSRPNSALSAVEVHELAGVGVAREELAVVQARSR